MTDSTAEHRFREFVHARTPALSRTAYLLTGDAHLAEDLVQTALFKAAKAWHRIEGDPEPYVRRILYTQNVSWWRSRKIPTCRAGTESRCPAGSWRRSTASPIWTAAGPMPGGTSPKFRTQANPRTQPATADPCVPLQRGYEGQGD